MNKNKILTVFATAMLSSCAGFAMEFDAKTPVKPRTQVVSVQVGDEHFNVTPNTKDIIDGRKEKEVLGTPAIRSKIEEIIGARNMHPRTRWLAIENGIEEEREKREKVLEELASIAREKQGRVTYDDKMHKMEVSVHKLKQQNLFSEELLSEKLTKATAESQMYCEQISALSTEMSALTLRHDKELETKRQEYDQVVDVSTKTAAELEEEKLVASEREAIYLAKVQRLSTQINDLKLKYSTSEKERSETDIELRVALQNLQTRREMEAARAERLKTLHSRGSSKVASAFPSADLFGASKDDTDPNGTDHKEGQKETVVPVVTTRLSETSHNPAEQKAAGAAPGVSKRQVRGRVNLEKSAPSADHDAKGNH